MNNIPLYALPGTMCDARIWSQLTAQNSHFTLEHVPIPSGADVSAMVQALADLLPSTAVNLLGFSLGGYLAAAFCVQYPQRVKKLFVVANSPSALPEDEVEMRHLTLGFLEKTAYRGIAAARIDFLLHSRNQGNPALHKIIAEMDESCGKAMLVQQLSATTTRVDLSRRLQQLHTPVDFIYGEEDRLVNPELISNICKIQGNKHYHCISGAGHMLPLETAAQLAALVNAGLER